MTDRLLEALASFVIRNRVFVLVGILVLFLVALTQTTKITADFTPQDLFTTFEEEQAVLEEFKAVFGNTESVLLILVQTDDVLEQEVVQYIHDVSLHFETAGYVERLESITATSYPRSAGERTIEVSPIIAGATVDPAEVETLREVVERSPLVQGTLISRSGRLAAVALFLSPDAVRIEALSAAIEDVESFLSEHGAPDGVRTTLGGIPHVRAEIIGRFTEDQMVFIPLAMLFSFVVLVICFRWLPGVIFPGFAVVVSSTFIVGAMAAIGEPINIINQVVPTLIVIIGMSDAVHLVSRFREEAATAGDSITASRNTYRHMALACFLTSVTTAVGFGSLVVSRTDILQRFGVTSAIGVLFAYVVTINLLPPLLSWTKPKKVAIGRHAKGGLEGFVTAIVGTSIRHPVIVVTGASVLLGTAILVASQVTVETRLLETFEEGDEVSQTVHLVQEELDGVLPFEVSLSSSTHGRFDKPDVLNAMQSFDREIASLDSVLSVTCYTDLLAEARVAYYADTGRRELPFDSEAEVVALASLIEGGRPNPIAPFVTLDRRRARVNVQIADMGSRAAIRLAEEIKEVIAVHFGDLEDVDVQLTGDAYVGSAGLTSLVHDMLASLLMAFGIIFVFMTLMFKSLRMGLLSIPPNVIPLVMTMAFMTLAGIELNTTTVVTFSISIGLAVDDTIHMLARFREEIGLGGTRDDAIMAAARGAGRAIVVTSVCLGGGMLVLLFSSFVPIRQFSVLLSVTVVSCIIGDLVLLPALLKLGWRD